MFCIMISYYCCGIPYFTQIQTFYYLKHGVLKMAIISKRIMGELRSSALYSAKKLLEFSIQNLCHKIESNEIAVPMYQRDLNWPLAQSVDLFNTQLHAKYTIAPISITEINTDTENKQLDFLTKNPIQTNGRIFTIVDGQQRLLTNYKAYIGHAEFDTIVLDLNFGKFRDIKNKEPKPHQIPVTKLLNKDFEVFTNYLRNEYSLKNFNELYPLLVEVRSKLLRYSYTINIVDDLTLNEQKEWFKNLNRSNNQVKTLMLGVDESDAFNMESYFSEFRTLVMQSSTSMEQIYSPLPARNSYSICALNAWYTVTLKKSGKSNFAPIPSDTKNDLIQKLAVKNPEQLEEITNKTLVSLELALEFLQKNNLIEYIERIDFILYLMGYLAFHDNEIKNPDALVKWVKETDFSKKDNVERRMIYADLISL